MKSIKVTGLLLLATVTLLTGCETVPTTDELTGQAEDVVQKKISDTIVNKSSNNPPQRSETVTPAQSVIMPLQPITMTISFTKMSAKLDKMAQQQLEQMLPLLKTGDKVTITGYCDRSAIKNATRAAKARALTVKEELVRLGIDVNKISIANVTNEARHVATISSEIGGK